ncbi:hypothetical protein ANANG_G00313320 [Anguilla anguilla]|uniref:Telomere repeat-binding factor dimerisation domain-containing protein n=1 Tax=Anguilla anguilla TaxID=7936 RepID=A0A9D3LIJ5_ANGAN|nr:hypothetical protein ANANG_G00313320 [Anguilla anguilla]
MGSIDPRMEAFIQGMVNDWCADWYTTVAINAFRGADYEKFYKFRDVIQGLVALPVENMEKFKRRIRVIQFLSRIHDCIKPGDMRGGIPAAFDLIFEYEEDCSPLESALRLVLSIEQEIFVPWDVADNTKKSILEALVTTLRKQKQHMKPEELIQKWDFPKKSQKERLLELLSKYEVDPAHDQFSYEAFKKSMMEFSENIFTMPQPFLRLIAKEEIASKYLYEHGISNCQPALRDGEAGPSARLTTPVVMAADGTERGDQQGGASFSDLECEVRQEVESENALLECPAEGSQTLRPCTIPWLPEKARNALEKDPSSEESPLSAPPSPVLPCRRPRDRRARRFSDSDVSLTPEDAARGPPPPGDLRHPGTTARGPRPGDLRRPGDHRRPGDLRHPEDHRPGTTTARGPPPPAGRRKSAAMCTRVTCLAPVPRARARARPRAFP